MDLNKENSSPRRTWKCSLGTFPSRGNREWVASYHDPWGNVRRKSFPTLQGALRQLGRYAELMRRQLREHPEIALEFPPVPAQDETPASWPAPAEWLGKVLYR